LFPNGRWRSGFDEGEESRAAEGRRAIFALARRMFDDDVLNVRTLGEGEEIAPGMVAVAAHGLEKRAPLPNRANAGRASASSFISKDLNGALDTAALRSARGWSYRRM
jgi:hypothetical protein